jgi:hypothetical protein
MSDWTREKFDRSYQKKSFPPGRREKSISDLKGFSESFQSNLLSEEGNSEEELGSARVIFFKNKKDPIDLWSRAFQIVELESLLATPAPLGSCYRNENSQALPQSC